MIVRDGRRLRGYGYGACGGPGQSPCGEPGALDDMDVANYATLGVAGLLGYVALKRKTPPAVRLLAGTGAAFATFVGTLPLWFNPKFNLTPKL